MSETSAAGEPAAVYFRTATGTRVHRPECPHLVGTDAHAATPAERLQHPVCDWSRAQDEGYGREYFDTVEDAMRRVGVPVEAHDTILDALRFVRHDEVFTVHSLTYGALGSRRAHGRRLRQDLLLGGRRAHQPAVVRRQLALGPHGAQGLRRRLPECHFDAALTGVCDDC